MNGLTRRAASALLALTVMGVVAACVKDTTFNPYAKPEHSELDRLQNTVNSRPDLEAATAQLTALDARIRSVINQNSPQTVIGPSVPQPDRRCVDPYVHTIGESYTIEHIAARPTPTTEQFQQIADTLAPVLATAGFKPNTPAGVTQAAGTLSWIAEDGASVKLINSAGHILLYDYSTGCRLPAAWRTTPPPSDERPVDDPEVHFPYLYGSPGGRAK